MNVKDIILDYLKKNNYYGLCFSDIRCVCSIDDFISCCEDFSQCEPIYKVICEQCNKCYERNPKNYCYTTEKIMEFKK